MADTLKEMTCPACQKLMKKVLMPGSNINVDICIDGCGGIFFDNRELKRLDEKAENIDEILNAISNKTFEKINPEQLRICPACGMKMVKNYTSIKKEVQMDECYACGGRFLDAGELQGLRIEYNTEAERSADVINLVNKTVAPMIQQMDAEHQEALKHQSGLKKLFDSIIDKAL